MTDTIAPGGAGAPGSLTLPAALCGLGLLALLALQTHLFCDVLCFHGPAHAALLDLCRG